MGEDFFHVLFAVSELFGGFRALEGHFDPKGNYAAS
jgi:hypothetical protein